MTSTGKHIRAVCLVAFMMGIMAVAVKAQIKLGKLTGYRKTDQTLYLESGKSAMRMVFYKPGIIRVDFLPTRTTRFDSSLVVIRDADSRVGFNVRDMGDSLYVTTKTLHITINKNPIRLTYRDSTGSLLLKDAAAGGFAADSTHRSVTFQLQPNEHFYGTGERGIGLDLRGHAFNSKNTQIGGYGRPLPVMNINVPFLATSRGFGLYFEDTWPGHYDLGASDSTTFSYSVLGGELAYYFIAGKTIKQQLKSYTWLTGREPLPPEWALGYLQAKYGYRNEVQARGMIDTMRAQHIPADAIILDLYWFKQMGDLSWNRQKWPDPSKMTADFLKRGFKTVVISEPYFVTKSFNYPYVTRNKYVALTDSGTVYTMPNWWSCRNCSATLFDMTNPKARNWLWKQYRDSILGTGVSGFWTDLGEPERDRTDMHFYMGPDLKIHNIYNLLWARMLYTNYKKAEPDKRMFNQTRSGYAGMQRFGAISWSGDVQKSFGGLSVQLPIVLNMGMSGMAYHGSDLGGFTNGKTTTELYIRWMEFGMFSPLARAHSVDTIQPSEPWTYGKTAEKIVTRYIRLRYRLLPYTYSMAYKNYKSGMPLVRPLFFLDPADPHLANYDSAYMFGKNFLVAPVVHQGIISKNVYLPQTDNWVNYWNDKVYKGGQTVTVNATLSTLPLFVRSGSIIPMQPVMSYVGQRPVDTLTVAVYPDPNKTARFNLYEDDGETLNYQHGSYARTMFTAGINDAGHNHALKITIGALRGHYSRLVSNRTYRVEVHNIKSYEGRVLLNNKSLKSYQTGKELQKHDSGFYYDKQHSELFIQLHGPVRQEYDLSIANAGIAVPE